MKHGTPTYTYLFRLYRAGEFHQPSFFLIPVLLLSLPLRRCNQRLSLCLQRNTRLISYLVDIMGTSLLQLPKSYQLIQLY